MTVGARGGVAGKDSDALRGPAGSLRKAGDVGEAGAVILVPQ